uniref:Thioredoxin domain-containing protein n=1 Tax=Eutreptiella gymnastica TaxID=73025 RepID=A0A7S1J100_9EUGL
MSDEMVKIVGEVLVRHAEDDALEPCSTRDVLKGKVVGVYFSAHWCPPCRAFTPVLVTFYKKMKEKGQEFEIIFVSSDSNQEAFTEYYKSMPWLAVPFDDLRKKKLHGQFGTQGIPHFALMEPDGTLITNSARGFVNNDPNGVEFPWRNKEAPSTPGGGLRGYLPVLYFFVFCYVFWSSRGSSASKDASDGS